MGRFSEWQARLQPASTGADGPQGVDAAISAASLPDGKAPSDLAADEAGRQEQALPLGLRVGMRVRIRRDVYWADWNDLCVAAGTPGNVVRYCDEDHVMVEADRAFREGYKVTYPVKLRAETLERHPLEKMQLDPRTAPVGKQDPDEASPEEDSANKWQDWQMPKRPQAKPPELGSGTLYEVVGEKAAHRAAPSVAAPVLGCKFKGRYVELFEWDETRLWRRCVDSTSWISGWMMLDSPEFGPLLRPKGLPFQVKPHEPLCVAAHENNAVDVKAFLREGVDVDVQDAGQRTPLGVAAAAGHLDMCVLLVMSGANAFNALSQQRADEESGEEQGGLENARLARALLAAFASVFRRGDRGRAGDDDLRLLRVALAQLSPEFREVACRWLREAKDDELRHLGWRQWSAEDSEDSEDLALRPGRRREDLEDRATPANDTSEELPGTEADAPGADGPAEVARCDDAGPAPTSESPQVASSDDAGVAEVSEALEAAPEKEAPPKDPPKKYEVVVKTCAIRAEPSQAARAIGARACKAVIELHEFDESGLWRKVPASMLGDRGDGWMLLTHMTLGQLLRPVDD